MKSSNPRGTILIVVMLAVFTIAGLSAAVLHVGWANAQAQAGQLVRYRAFEIAEAGAAQQAALIFSGNGPTSTSTTTTGWRPFANGQFNAAVDAVWGAGVDRVSVTSTGQVDGTTEVVTMEFNRSAATIHESFLKAVYAGNTSEISPNGTPIPPNFNYNLQFGGGKDAFDSNGPSWDGDLIVGDIYAAGNINRTNEAMLNGEVKGMGNLTLDPAGQSAHTKVLTNNHVSPPNLAAMDYANTADIKITNSTPYTFQAGIGGRNSNTTQAAHMFTKNRTNMGTENGYTPKNDYYLEDLYDNSTTTVGGVSSKTISPSAGVQNKVIYVDGNVWVHNKSIISFAWSSNTKLTIVASGNIYFSDDLRIRDANSMVAFIAIKDPALTNPDHSGNVVLGDPAFGTVDFLDAILYAERDFKDQNLSSAGAASFEILGGMLAGNQVKINRDYTVSSSHWEWVPTLGANVWVPAGAYHSELLVKFDNRLSDPNFTKPPGLPQPSGTGTAGSWSFRGWRRGV